MADLKISELANLTGADPILDMLPIVDVSATPPASGSTKRISINNLLSSSPTASGALTVTGLVTAGSATITGDLTVRTTKLAVTSTGVGCGTATPALPFVVSNAGAQGFEINPNGTLIAGGVDILSYNRSTSLYKGIGFGAESYLFKVGTASVTDAMTLNSTGLGIGDAPATNSRLTIGTTNATGFQYALRTTGITTGRSQIYLNNTSGDFIAGIESSVAGTSITGTAAYSSYVGTSTANPFHIATNGSVKATVDSSGNVGIGVTPSAWATYKAVSVGGIGASVFGLGSSQGGLVQGAYYSNLSGSGWAYTATSQVPAYYLQINGEHRFHNAISGTAGAQIAAWTQAMTLDASGNLLVGATSSSETSGVGHKINTSATAPWLATVGSVSTNSNVTSSVYSTGAAAYRFYVGFGGTVFATNTVISAISDARFKENVQDIDVGLAAILSLKPRKFDWKSGKGKDIKGDRGFIAQEFETVFPSLIDEWKDPAPEGEAPYKSVRQDLIPVLVKAIQELTARVQTLEAR